MLVKWTQIYTGTEVIMTAQVQQNNLTNMANCILYTP